MTPCTRRDMLRLGGGTVAALAAGPLGHAAEHTKPLRKPEGKGHRPMNVLLIISDTVRHDYLGCYGSPWVKTPHLDALARESALMTRFFTASFPTGPMRKDVHAGRFTFPYTNWSQPRATDELVLAELAKAKGYRTAYIGDTSNSPQLRQGFDHEQVISSRASKIGDVPATVKLPAASRKLRIPTKRIQNIVRNAMGWDGETDRRAPRTMLAAHRWLEDQVGADAPFFLWVDTFDPHEPWDPPHYYIDRYDPGYSGDELMEPAYEPADYATPREIHHMRRMYAGELSMVDRWVGYLLDGIRRMGLADDTAILFTSDHGFYHGEHNLIGKVQLDRKGAICRRWPLYDTIAHPPLLVRVPGLTKGQKLAPFCQPPDLTATMLDLMGIPAPDRVQGQSLLPVLRGERRKLRDFAVSSLTYITDAQVRCPTSFRTRDHLYIYGGDEWPSELYDLHADPEESKNLIGSAKGQQLARQLHAQYLDALKSIDCPQPSLDAREEFRPTPRPKLPYRRLL